MCIRDSLEALGHLVGVVVCHSLLDQRVVRVPSSLQEHAAPEPDALFIALEDDELGGDSVVATVGSLLSGRPG